MKCTCEQAVREKLEELAAWCDERAGFEWADPQRAWAYGRVRDHIREQIALLPAEVRR